MKIMNDMEKIYIYKPLLVGIFTACTAAVQLFGNVFGVGV